MRRVARYLTAPASVLLVVGVLAAGCESKDAADEGAKLEAETLVETAAASLPKYTGTNTPVGVVEAMGRQFITGWACISDYGEPLWVHFYDGIQYIGSTRANGVNRADVADSCGGRTRRGFDWTLPRMDGSHAILAFASDSPAPRRSHPLAGPSSVTWPYPSTGDSPIGYVESITPTSISGWACDPSAPGSSLELQVYIRPDGISPQRFVTAGKTSGSRSDIVSICGSGVNTAFSIDLPATMRKGLNDVIVYGINQGAGTNNALNETANLPDLADFGCTRAEQTGADDTDDLQAVLDTGEDLVLCPGLVYNLMSKACGDWALCYKKDGQAIVTRGLPDADTGQPAGALVANDPSVLGVLKGEYANLTLRSVIVEGNRRKLGVTAAQYKRAIALVEFHKAGAMSPGQFVVHNKLRGARSWSNLHLICATSDIAYNKLEDAGCSKAGNGCSPGDPVKTWADGMSIDCGNSLVYGNTLENATDGAIVLFYPAGTEVFGNTIRAIDRELLGGINMVDAGRFVTIDGTRYSDYRGVRVHHNTIIARGKSIDVGIAQGSDTWFCGSFSPLLGAVVTDNTFAGAFFHWGAVLDNVSGWTFTRNTFSGRFRGPITKSPCAGSGTIPSPSRKCAKNHLLGSNNSIQSTCGALAEGEAIHEVLLDN